MENDPSENTPDTEASQDTPALENPAVQAVAGPADQPADQPDEVEEVMEPVKGDAASDAQNTTSDEEEEALDLSPLEAHDLVPWVETILFCQDKPLSLKKLHSLLGDGVQLEKVEEALSLLKEDLDGTHRPYTVVEIAKGFQLMTRQEYAPILGALHKPVTKKDLSPAVIETLSIIAYKQPVTRQDIENIRGVGCGSMVRRLMELKLVKVVGRAEILGSPLLYGTSNEFLEAFGLKSLDELPDSGEFKDQ